MQWIELTIQTTSTAMDLVAAELTALGHDSFIMDDEVDFHEFLENNHQYWDYVDEELEAQMKNLSQIRLYLEDSPQVQGTIDQLRGDLKQLITTYPAYDFGSLTVDTATRKNEDWENNWKQYYNPIPIGKKLLVVPQWMNPENPEGRIPVLLDPGMIFGTGSHASTQMCMKALEDTIVGGERIIDLGSGSGILSFTALLLGGKTALGVDIDPKAEDIARSNGAINALTADRFQAVTGNVIDDKNRMMELAEGGYDIVLANIVADVIIPLAPVVPHFLRPKGTFICSGILDVRLGEVVEALQSAGLTITQTNTMDDWCQLTAIL